MLDITMILRHVEYILDLSMTLTFDLYVGGGGILSEVYWQFLTCYYLIPDRNLVVIIPFSKSSYIDLKL